MTALKASFQQNEESHTTRDKLGQPIGAAVEHRWLWAGLILFCFVIPIKLSWAYAVLIPLILGWMVTQAIQNSRFKESLFDHTEQPILLWIMISLVTSLFGIDPMRSFISLSSLAFLLALLFVTKDIVRQKDPQPLILALIMGQSIAALDTVFEPLISPLLRTRLVGPVTESGQLALVIPVTLGLFFANFKRNVSWQQAQLTSRLAFLTLTLGFVAFTSCGFILRSNTDQITRAVIFAVMPVLILTIQILRFKDSRARLWLFLANICIPLLLAALVLNLKRGPWIGVIFALTLLLLQIGRRYALPVLLVILISASLISPVRDRLLESYKNFSMAGGRQTMWEIGLELSAKYPLGIGFHNGEILDRLDPNIPQGYNHLHNNLLNILAETGWIGMILFAWWIYRILKRGLIDSNFNSPVANSTTAFCLGLSLLAWQIAGLVEYNFGDSEVLLIALLLCGALSGLGSSRGSLSPSTQKA